MAAAGLSLALAPPAGPVEVEGVLGAITQQDGQQATHFRDGHRDQFGVRPPFAPLAARVTSRNACASKQRVMWRYHPAQRRTSY